MSARRASYVYPTPYRMEPRPGRFTPRSGGLALHLSSGAPRPVKAAAAITAEQLSEALRREVEVTSDRRLPAFAAALCNGKPTTLKPLRGGRPESAASRGQSLNVEIRRDGIAARATGWSGLEYAMMTLLDCCDNGLRCVKISDGPRFGIRAMLLHLGYNQWLEKPSKEIVYGYSDRLRFDRDVFDEAVALMARLRMNMVLLDLGDAIRYRSHPEIAVKGAITPSELKGIIKQCRSLGIEPIPKLNFATTHDAWLKGYGRMVGTRAYNMVCDDLIAEITELFDGPRFFHIGMDEETIEHCRGLQLEHIVLREGKAWLDAVKRLDRSVRAHGARTWMWGDPLWPDRHGPAPAIPKHILLSDWNYSKRTTFPTSKAIEAMGYEDVPAGANWTQDENIALYARYAAKHLDPKKVPGMMMTVWNPTVRSCRRNILNSISLAAGATWNPDGESRSPWARDHYAGRWKCKKKP
jgi:hypothetical protein